jgi:hypothetical protein
LEEVEDEGSKEMRRMTSSVIEDVAMGRRRKERRRSER